MSYSEVLIAPCVGPVEPVKRFSNSWGFAARIWQSMSQRYFGRRLTRFSDGEIRKVWDLWKDPDYPLGRRAVLLSTFDHAMIEWDRLEEMADHYYAFAREMPCEGEDHLYAMANLFRELAASDRQDMAGVCFYPMSVGVDLWYTEVEGQEDARRYDVSRDEGHWFVFESLKDLETDDRLPDA